MALIISHEKFCRSIGFSRGGNSTCVIKKLCSIPKDRWLIYPVGQRGYAADNISFDMFDTCLKVHVAEFTGL